MALKLAEKPTTEPETGGIAADRLRSLVDRIERLEEERKALGSDIKDIYAEAKSAGFDVKVLRQLIRIRKQERRRWRSRKPCSTCTAAHWECRFPSPSPRGRGQREGPCEGVTYDAFFAAGGFEIVGDGGTDHAADSLPHHGDTDILERSPPRSPTTPPACRPCW